MKAFEDHGFNIFLFHEKLLVPRTSEDLQEIIVVDYLATRRSAGFGDFEIRSLTIDERIELVLQMVCAELVEYRRHIAAALKDAPEHILTHKNVEAALSKLTEDENEIVREAASWARSSTNHWL